MKFKKFLFTGLIISIILMSCSIFSIIPILKRKNDHNKIQPRIAVPMHYDIGENHPQEFKKFIDREIEVKILQ